MNQSGYTSESLISALNLEDLSGESGFWAGIARSDIETFQDGRPLKANNSIYYLLNRKKPINYLHWLAPDDIHVLCEGGPVDYYVFSQKGKADHHVLGKDLSKGQRPVLMIPGGSWKALKLQPDIEFALMVTIVTPEWTEDRLKIGAGQKFIDEYANHSAWATPEFLKELIGPNFQTP